MRVAEAFLEQGIRLKNYHPGHKEQVICPQCGGGGSREKSLRCWIDDDGSGGGAKCYRGKCGWSWSTRGSGAHANREHKPKRVYVAPEPHAETPLPQSLVAYWASRGISEPTLRKAGVYLLSSVWFPAVRDKASGSEYEAGEYPAMVFPYVMDGQLTNRKYRPRHKVFRQEKDAKPTLWNIDACEGADVVTVVEGEADGLTVIECYSDAVTSLPSGADDRPDEDDDGALDGRFQALETSGHKLRAAKRFIIATDMDAPGEALARKLIRRLGPGRCCRARMPDGCKDLNEVLMAYGPEAVREVLDAAEPVPIENITTFSADDIISYQARKRPESFSTGIWDLDPLIRIPENGRLIAVTGHPGMGKSSFVRWQVGRWAMNKGWHIAMFDPEKTTQVESPARTLSAVLRKPLWPVNGRHPINPDDVNMFSDFLARIHMITIPEAIDRRPTFDEILETGRDAILRWGIRALIIDPWNEVDLQVGRYEDKDEAVNVRLIRLRRFAHENNCHVIIVAHPPKGKRSVGDRLYAPVGQDIAGSSHFANRVEIGLTIHRGSMEGETEVIVWKMREAEFGNVGKRTIAIDPICGSFSGGLENLKTETAKDE